jgi:hypothetical protein
LVPGDDFFDGKESFFVSGRALEVYRKWSLQIFQIRSSGPGRIGSGESVGELLVALEV